MSEHDLFGTVGQARDRLAELRAKLEKESATPGSNELVGALLDVQEMLDTLRTRYGFLHEVLDRTNDVVFAKDRDGRFVMINPQGARLFGKSVTDLLGADDRSLYGRVEGERIMTLDRQVMDTKEPRTAEETHVADGVSTTLLTTTTAWYDARRLVRGVIGIAQDVTQRRRDEREATRHRDRMNAMFAEIVIGEERLRRSLAAELHSGLGQDIALAKLRLSTLRATAVPEMRAPLEAIEELVERADRALATITFQISPPSLHDLGLVAALEWLGEDIHHKYGIAVRIEDEDSPAVHNEITRVFLFRAVRELLINVATHANVGETVVRLSQQNGFVRITVEDAGMGFDTSDLDRRGHGLLGIREQLRYIDGSMQVVSVPGQGTKVTLTAAVSGRMATV